MYIFVRKYSSLFYGISTLKYTTIIMSAPMSGFSFSMLLHEPLSFPYTYTEYTRQLPLYQ